MDISDDAFDPMAKLAKDIAAGAVLVAALNAVAVGYLVFSGEVATRSSRFLTRLSDAPAELTLVAVAVTVIIVIAIKAYTGRGTPLRGGLPSGHAAVAFAGWMAVTLILDDSASLPDLLGDVHHGVARGTDSSRPVCTPSPKWRAALRSARSSRSSCFRPSDEPGAFRFRAAGDSRLGCRACVRSVLSEFRVDVHSSPATAASSRV